MDARLLADRRRTPILVVGLAALLTWLAFAVIGGGGHGACAAPRPGYHSVPSPWTYVWAFGPGTLTFLVAAYLALGVRRLWLRWMLVFLSIALAIGVTFVAVILVPSSCGISVPD